MKYEFFREKYFILIVPIEQKNPIQNRCRNGEVREIHSISRKNFENKNSLLQTCLIQLTPCSSISCLKGFSPISVTSTSSPSELTLKSLTARSSFSESLSESDISSLDPPPSASKNFPSLSENASMISTSASP